MRGACWLWLPRDRSEIVVLEYRMLHANLARFEIRGSGDSEGIERLVSDVSEAGPLL
jgi:hypothetical protein